jgi:hypothetical protein
MGKGREHDNRRRSNSMSIPEILNLAIGLGLVIIVFVAM